MCLVSFLVPVYNLREAEVKTCISSIANQTVSDLEIIIVDDGSSNGIGEYCDKISSEFGAKVIHQQNQGLAVARNTGMKAAQGEWIVHVDGDDWVDNRLVEMLKEKSANSMADIIVWGFTLDNGKKQQTLLLKNKTAFDAEYASIKESILCSILDYDDSFADLSINTSWAKAYRHDFIKSHDLFYNPLLRRAQDAVYNLYAFSKASKVDYIDAALNIYRNDNVSLSRGFNPKTFDYLLLTSKAVECYVNEYGVSQKVKDASMVFIERCFRMINEQFYQHKDNKLPYCERKAAFLQGIETEPFRSAFTVAPQRAGLINVIPDYLYKYKSFIGIAFFNKLFGIAYNIKKYFNK